MCKFDFPPSQKLAEGSSLDGGFIVKTAHRMQTSSKQPNEKDPAQSLPFGCFIAPQGDSGVPAVTAPAELAVAAGGLLG